MSELPSFRSSLNGFNRNDVITFIKSILDENADLLAKLAEAQNTIGKNAAEIEELQKRLETVSAERQNEEMLGRAMYDARRFSDILVKEANDEAAAILNNTAAASEDITQDVNGIAEETAQMSLFFADAIGSIQEKITALNQSLNAFRARVANKKDNLGFASDTYAEEVAPAVSEDGSEQVYDDEEQALQNNDAAQRQKLTVRRVKR